MPHRKALGRGLDALLPEETTAGTVRLIHVDEIKRNPFQPRQKINEQELQELVSSIREKGVLQPLLVRQKDGGYELVAGERRWLAAKQAGLDKVPALIIDVSDQEALEIALIENLQREDLNLIEEAAAYRKLIDEFGLTQAQIAERVGKDRSTIANRLRLLALHPDVISMLTEGILSEGHARVLLRLDGTEQVKFANMVVEKGLSVRELENLIQSKKPKRMAKRRSLQVASEFERKLTESIGMPVKLKLGRRGGGSIQIKFKNLEQLREILSKILGTEIDELQNILSLPADIKNS